MHCPCRLVSNESSGQWLHLVRNARGCSFFDEIIRMDQTPQTQGMGKGFIIGSWLLAIGLLTLLFQGVLDDRRNPNRRPQVQQGLGGAHEVVLRRNVQGHYLARGSINGRAVVFLLDTGATDVALPTELAHGLNLELLGRGLSQTAAGMVEVGLTRLDQVELGGIVMRDVPASVVDGMDTDEVLLGMAFLKHLELLQKGDTLTLRVPGESAG